MVQSIIVYTILMLLMVYFCKYVSNKRKQPFMQPAIFFCCSIFAIIMGIRYDVGIDYLNYLDIYNTIKAGFEVEDIELGWIFLNRIPAFFNSHYTIFFGFIAFIQVFLLLYAFKTEKYLYPFIVFVLMTSYFIPWTNVMRQNLSFCIFLCSIPYIVKRNHIAYFFTILICLSIHKSAFILILIYPFFLLKKEYVPRSAIQVMLYLLFFYLNRNSFIQNYFDIISDLAMLTSYGEEYGYRATTSQFNVDWRLGPRVLIIVIINLLVFYLSPKLKQYYNSDKFNIIYTLYFWGSCVWLLLYGNYILQRVIEYFYYLSLPIYAYTLFFLCKQRHQNSYNKAVWIIFLMLEIGVYMGSIYSTSLPDDKTRYYFFWQKDLRY